MGLQLGVRGSITMGGVKYVFLLLVVHCVSLRGEDEVMDDEEVIEQNEGGKEIDWSQMLQMGMALGKGLLGEEAVEKLKRGDLSELIKIGEKVLGEETVKDFLNSATEGAFAPKEDEEQEDDNAEEMSSGFVDEEMTLDTSNTVDPSTQESTEEVTQTTEKVADEL